MTTKILFSTGEAIKNAHLSKTGTTYSIDFMIGNPAYFGKGLGSETLRAFIVFFSQSVDPQVDTFFIDPDVNNPRAKHVYEKSRFEFIDEFILEGSGCFSGRKTHFLVKRLKSVNQVLHWFMSVRESNQCGKSEG